MRIKQNWLAGTALCAALLASCVANEDGDSQTAPEPFIDPLILSQSRCGGPPAKPLTPEQTADMAAEASFDFAKPFALPDTVVAHFHYPIGADNPEAQTWFDTGLTHMANFNHDEAIAAFRQAQADDPACAMCYWGEALAFGSNINAPFEAPRGAAGREAADQALAAIAAASDKQAALIQAIDTRYSTDELGRSIENAEAYADAMDAVARAYPDDKFILSLAAEANMDTQPWDYWQAGARVPKGRTARTIEMLETALDLDPEFAPAIHLYIHATEASVDPFRAEGYADRLYEQSLGIGHLVHMPSHIYLKLGRWKKSHTANIKAIAADEAYIAGSDNAAFYGAVYYPHNVHFVVANSQLAGNEETALEMAAKLAQIAQLDPSTGAPFAEHIAASELFAQLQFGKDASVLNYPEPAEAHVYMRIAWHYARGTVFARHGEIDSARHEAAQLAALAEQDVPEAYAAVGMPLAGTANVALLTLKGRIKLADGNLEGAVAKLDEAADLHKQIPYFEPAWWYYPTRQTLGAYLLLDGQYDRAEREFFKTLIDAPNNAYALYGLAETYKAKGETASEAYARRLFDEAWMGAEGTVPNLTDL